MEIITRIETESGYVGTFYNLTDGSIKRLLKGAGIRGRIESMFEITGTDPCPATDRLLNNRKLRSLNRWVYDIYGSYEFWQTDVADALWKHASRKELRDWSRYE